MEIMRTCLVCRKSSDRRHLLRFVRGNDGEICFDEKAQLSSRGAWICGTKLCIEKAFNKKMLFRSQPTLPVDVNKMLSFIESRLKEATLSRLGLLKRMAKIEFGHDKVLRSAVQSEPTEVIVFASDFATRSINSIVDKLTDTKTTKIYSTFSMSDLGKSLGREKTGVVALHKSRITEEILLKIKILSEIRH